MAAQCAQCVSCAGLTPVLSFSFQLYFTLLEYGPRLCLEHAHQWMYTHMRAHEFHLCMYVGNLRESLCVRRPLSICLSSESLQRAEESKWWQPPQEGPLLPFECCHV